MKLIDSKEGEERKIVAIGGSAKKQISTLFGYFKAQYEGQQNIEVGIWVYNCSNKIYKISNYSKNVNHREYN